MLALAWILVVEVEGGGVGSRVCRLRWGLQFLYKLLLLFHTPAHEEAFRAPSTISVFSCDQMLAFPWILVVEVEGSGVGSRVEVGSRGDFNAGHESGTFGVEKRLVIALLF
jgi:hypothetical protein